MSPELLIPEEFGLRDSYGTKSSDCYALGMTVYEVLSGHIPFHKVSAPANMMKVIKGERPERPQGTEGDLFTDDVWGILESCWKSEPGDRPTIDRVLQSLEEASGFWTPLPPLSPESPGEADSPGSVTSLFDLDTDEREVDPPK